MDTEEIDEFKQALADGSVLLEPYEDDTLSRRILALSAALACEFACARQTPEEVDSFCNMFVAATKDFVAAYNQTLGKKGCH
jgi:hypothetical protein